GRSSPSFARRRATSRCCSRPSVSPCSSTSRWRSPSAWCSPHSCSSAAWRRAIPKGVLVYEINGPFFFGAAETFRETLGQIAARPKVLVIRMRDVGALDSTGIHALKDVIHRTRRDGAAVLLADVHAQPLAALTASAVMDELGPGAVYSNIDDALVHARGLLGAAANAA